MDFMNNNVEISQVYHVSSFIGKGEYGLVYKGETNVGKRPVAIKIEMNESGRGNVVMQEFRVMKKFSEESVHLPQAYDLFIDLSDTYGCMCSMELLGCDLKSWLSKQPKPLPKKVLYHIIDQLVETMAQFHSYNYVHQDIKLDNFCVAYGDDNSSYPLLKLIDFGGGQSIKIIKYDQENDSPPPVMVGTILNSSLTSELLGYQSYTDDLESLGFLIWKLQTNAPLPWESTNVNQEQRISLKRDCILQKTTPDNIRNFIKQIRPIPKWELPNYKQLKTLLIPSNEELIKIPSHSHEYNKLNDRYRDCSTEYIIERKFFNSFNQDSLSDPAIPGLDQNGIDILIKNGITTRSKLVMKCTVRHQQLVEMGIPSTKVELIKTSLLRYHGR
jgi:serine/threonine protein kinase